MTADQDARAVRVPAADPPPLVALRTYLALRMAMVAVIIGLGVSIAREIENADGCVQRSISAYYYTPVRTVFVGTLIVLGVAMIALWGKNLLEDALLNLAGMLAPVVAFVPTLDANYCSLTTTSGRDLAATAEDNRSRAEAAKDALIVANGPAVQNNVFTLLVVLAAALVFIAVFGTFLLARRWTGFDRRVAAYLATWGIAAALWAVGTYRFNTEEAWLNRSAHWTSAVILFALVIAAVLAAAVDKLRDERVDQRTRRRWAAGYAALGVGMGLAAGFVSVTAGRWWGEAYAEHETFIVEAVLIGLLGVFWVLQTIDRRKEGAPTY